MNNGRKTVFAIQAVIFPVVVFLALTRAGVEQGMAVGISAAVFVALIALSVLIAPMMKRSDDEELRRQAVRKEIEDRQ